MANHLNALQLRLSHERARLTAAKGRAEIGLRTIWVAQIEKEIAREEMALGGQFEHVELSDDELLRALEA